MKSVAAPRIWIKCPHCHMTEKTNNYTQSAQCRGVWVKCKHCKQEFEIKITDGVQKRPE